jgi:hypothetical protein
MIECRSGGSGRDVIWIRKTGRISRSIQADFITSTVAFEGRVFSAQTVSSTLDRQNRSLRTGGSVFGPGHHLQRGLRWQGFSAVSAAVKPPLFAGEVAVLQTVSGGRYELSARKQQGPDRGLVAFHAET